MRIKYIVCIFVGICYITLELINEVVLLNIWGSMSSEVRKFGRESLERSGLIESKNYGRENYPYKITNLHYLCKEEYPLEEGASNLGAPSDVLEELATHSDEWWVYSRFSYFFLLIFQASIFIGIIILIIIIIRFPNVDASVFVVSILIGIGKIRKHAIHISACWISIFLIFNFHTCIQTQYPNNYQQLFTEKKYGKTLFFTEIVVICAYLASSLAGAYHIYLTKSQRSPKTKFIWIYIVLEILILIEQIVFLVHWTKYKELIKNETNTIINYHLLLSICLEKSLLLFFWIYFLYLADFQSYAIRPTSTVHLTKEQQEFLTLATETVITVENENEFQYIEHNVKGGSSCNICLDDVGKGDKVTRLQCSHLFHLNCIQEWVQNNPFMTCPNCRANIQIGDQVSIVHPVLNIKREVAHRHDPSQIAFFPHSSSINQDDASILQ